jgi:uncharacterized membrane protein
LKSEERIILASLFAGLSEIVFGLFMSVTGFHKWYFDNFHFFGIMGVCMVFYALWHAYLYRRETR